MNLDGKYIKLDSNNVESVIKFIYKNGYNWIYEDKTKIDVVLKTAIHNINVRNYTYIMFNCNSFYFQWMVEKNFEFFDINKYLREYKLKRILK